MLQNNRTFYLKKIIGENAFFKLLNLDKSIVFVHGNVST